MNIQPDKIGQYLLSERDNLFEKKELAPFPFEFNGAVAAVFDDMVSRSVPFYEQVHQLTLDVASKFLKKGDRVYDLGCSTGSTLCLIGRGLRDYSLDLVGIDNSPSMLIESRKKISRFGVQAELKQADLRQIELEECGLVIMNYTLQFIPQGDRRHLIRQINRALRPGGIFILSEKIISQDLRANLLLQELYYDFKRRNGYSELEISSKREALENVLVPLSAEEQLDLLAQGGFESREQIFRCYNFATFLGIKV